MIWSLSIEAGLELPQYFDLESLMRCTDFIVSDCNFHALIFFYDRNVPDRCRHSADHPALGVEVGVPPPRAAPALLRRVVLNCHWYYPVKLKTVREELFDLRSVLTDVMEGLRYGSLTYRYGW